MPSPVAAETDFTDHAGAATRDAGESESTLGQFIPLLYHYNMLQDEDRVGAFRAAIELVVKPGMHVVELGGGTGILSSFAARLGAHVTCVERNPELVAAARRFVVLNGLQNQIDVVQCDAVDFVPERKVDAVVCEMLHVGLLREKQAQVIQAFKRNYFNAFDGTLPVFLPEVSILMAQPVQHCFDFAGYTAPVPLFQAPLLDQPRTQPLAELQPYANIAYHETIPMNFESQLTFEATNTADVNAIRFVTQNVIGVDEKQQKAITWPNQCLVLPLGRSVGVSTGANITVSFEYHCGGTVDQLHRTVRVEASDVCIDPRHAGMRFVNRD